MACTLIGSLMRAKTIRNALIIAPLTVLQHWKKDGDKIIRKCVPLAEIDVVTSKTKKETRRRLIQAALTW